MCTAGSQGASLADSTPPPTWRALIRLGRPRFLIGGLVMNSVGVAAAAHAGVAIDWRRAVIGQALVSAAQLMTQYCNDYYDVEADRANLTPTRWSGGSRVIVQGAVPRGTALVAALFLAAVSLACALWLVLADGAPVSILLLASSIIFLAWEYSAPPLRLETRGLGELDAALVVAVLTPMLGQRLQGDCGGSILTIVAPLACFQFAMLLAIEVPDAAGDALAGKRTLVVRFGVSTMARLHAGVLAGAYVASPLLALSAWPPTVAWALLGTSPLAALQVVTMVRHHADPRRWSRLAFGAVALVALGGLAILAGLLADLLAGASFG